MPARTRPKSKEIYGGTRVYQLAWWRNAPPTPTNANVTCYFTAQCVKGDRRVVFNKKK